MLRQSCKVRIVAYHHDATELFGQPLLKRDPPPADQVRRLVDDPAGGLDGARYSHARSSHELTVSVKDRACQADARIDDRVWSGARWS
jgi:hypothetical protein